MRKSPAVVLLVGLVFGSLACGGSDDPEPSAGQSGNAPVTESTSTTTSEPESTTTTLPETVVDIPDVSDLELSWDEIGSADEVTGEVPVFPFNDYLVLAAPSHMVPEGTFDGLEGEELDEAVDEAAAEAPLKAVAVYLGLDPDAADTQMLKAFVGGPEGVRVIVIQSNLEDDSVRAIRWDFTIQLLPRSDLQPTDTTTTVVEAEGEETTSTAPAETTTTAEAESVKDLVPVLFGAVLTTQCQPDRGHQDFAPGLCV
jgi:hypothetical protein